MQEQNNIVQSLAHIKRNCKYHIVFAHKGIRYSAWSTIDKPYRDNGKNHKPIKGKLITAAKKRAIKCCSDRNRKSGSRNCSY